MTTTNLGLTLPTVGADSDAWGSDLNTALTTIDGAFGTTTAKAFDTTGARLVGSAFIWTDSTTAAGTLASAYGSSKGAVTYATGTNAITITDAYGDYFKAPVAGSHITLTNSWAVGADSVKFGTSNQFSVTTAGAVTIGAALTYGGVTLSSAVTGTGKMVLATSPTFSNAPTVNTRTGAAGKRTLLAGQDGNASGTGTVNLTSQMVDSVGTSGADILAAPDRASLVIVHGDDGTNFFSDLLNVSSNAVSVISTQNSAGSPGSRTYSISSFNLHLVMGSGTVNVHSAAVEVSTRS